MNKREFFSEIARQATQSELVFSTGAQVALKLRRSLEDPACHVSTAVKLIKAEPLLSARVIAIANSLVYNRSGREITDVQVAFSMLGTKTIQSLAMALVTRQMSGKAATPAQQELVNNLWQHSVHVASLAHAIARHVTHQDPEAALFAGIVHEIGGFYMLSRAGEFPELLDGDFADWIEGGEVEVGRAVINDLKLPKLVVAAIEQFWDGLLAMPPVTLADTLLLAEVLSSIPSPLRHVSSNGLEGSSKASIEMVIGESVLSQILADSATEISSLTAALQF